MKYNRYFILIYCILAKLWREMEIGNQVRYHSCKHLLGAESTSLLGAVVKEMLDLGYLKGYEPILKNINEWDNEKEGRRIRLFLWHSQFLQITSNGLLYFLNDPVMNQIRKDIGIEIDSEMEELDASNDDISIIDEDLLE